MQSKLYLKVSGASDAADLKLIQNNLNELVGIKAVTLTPFKGHAEIAIDFESNKISQQQIYDVIMIGGDFNIEEQSEPKIKAPTELKAQEEPASKSRHSSGAFSVSQGKFFASDPSNIFFLCGLLGGIAVASVMINILLAYLLLTPKV